MRIRLRPYHPTYVIGCYGMGGHRPGYNSVGFNEVIEKIKSDPDIEVQFVEEFDDICRKCTRLVEDEKGSVWGPRHRCRSSDDAELVRDLHVVNQCVLGILGLEYGSVIKLKDLVGLLLQRIPILFHNLIGGPAFQEKYEKGLVEISKLWE